ncbi:MAG TPA: 2-dehydropantoate 2-reductase [Sulfurimonas sp.]|nr:2-dehydropantoate 2-reductase [Sulfurimonas sp.]
MKIAIVGLGGVGGYIGAKLCSLKEEHEIIFIARGEHLKAIQDKGLRILDEGQESIYHPSTASQSYDEPLDLVFLCTKTYHSAQAIQLLGSCITKDTLLIPIANGVNSKDILSPITKAKLTEACVYIVSHITAPGKIAKATKVFALMLDSAYQKLLEPLFQEAGLRTKFSSDIKKEIWKKFLFISAMGSLTSYYEKGMGTIYNDHQDELKALLQEIYNVAKKEGINLDESEIDKALHTSSKLPLDAPTSMWLDIQAKGNNELESLSHYIILKAKEHHLDVPIMQGIYKKLK